LCPNEDEKEAGETKMWENVAQARKSQRWAAIMAVCILTGLLILMPVGGAFADWLNSTNAPSEEEKRYDEITGQTGVDFDMDKTPFKNSGDYKSYYIWKNETGEKNYNNVTHTNGVISVQQKSTAGNAIEGNISWNEMDPYFEIWFDYTAKEAYDDNVVRCRLYVTGIYVPAHKKDRTITFSAGDVEFYSVTIEKDDTDNTVDKNITINVNDLRRAIINKGDQSYFKLVVTAQDTTMSIAGSAMYNYNCTKLFGRDDGLFFIGALCSAITFAGVFLVQPRYSLPFGGKKGKGGGF